MAKSSVAPNASHHFWGFGTKDDSLDKELFAKYMVSVRGKDFESGNDISTETDEGHTGTASIDMGEYRNDATSEPEWEDAWRYAEGFEDLWYHLLGKYTKEEVTTGVYHYKFFFPLNVDPLDTTNPVELPLCTIYNGFAKTVDDGRVFNNAMLKEIECSFKNDEKPIIHPKYISDYNNFNMANPTRSYAKKTNFVKPKQVAILYGDIGKKLDELAKLGCYLESSFSVNNNAETQPCQEDDFGKNTKFMGSRETEGSFKVPWTDKTRKLEPEYEGGNSKAHSVTDESIYKQIAYDAVGGKIGDTTYNYRTLIHFPKIVLTNAESPLSGDEAKDLTVDWKVVEEPEQSFMTVEIWTDLSELHTDNGGCTLDDLKYDYGIDDPTNTPDTKYDVKFVVKEGTTPVKGATVAVGAVNSTTNDDGVATLSLTANSYSASISKTGYTTKTEQVQVKGKMTVNVALTKS